MRAPIALQLLGLLAAYAGAETHATPATPATFLHPLVDSNRSAPLLVPLARRPAPWNRTSAPEPRDWLAQLVRQTQQLYARREAYAAGVARFLRSVVAAFFQLTPRWDARAAGDAGARGADCAAVRRRPSPPAPNATEKPYDAAAALDAYALRRCAYATTANGAVLGALRFGSACVKPSDESSGGAPFADADLFILPRRRRRAPAARTGSLAFARRCAALRVAGCGIGDEGAARLLHALRKPGAPRLERLDVGGNGLGPQAVRRFKRLGALTRGSRGGGARRRS
ncbi:hypothetical protein JL722_10755 [Aureococcus anophagefferens]|nr:hypothetical protein JL722_10755 [Aureococcus anophagefferens]